MHNKFVRDCASLTVSIASFVFIGGCATPSAAPSAGNETNDSSTCAAEYRNPILWQDLPDVEVIRVDDTYYYTASTFHHSPGAPVLRSYDLVNWEYIGHSVPSLDFHPSYDLLDGNAYVNGIWASTLQYRKSNDTFYWMGCMHDEVAGGYVFTAPAAQGPWQKHKSEGCYYDMGLLIEDDTDKMYVASGHGTISVTELSDDGLQQVRHEVVFETPEDLTGPLEGARFYKINGNYYILLTQYANGEYVARSTNGPFGPYELKPMAVKTPYEPEDSGQAPHQGGIVQTQNDDWYYMAFVDAFPGGRLPVMAPVTWEDDWPVVTLVNGAWAESYPFPDLPCGADKITYRSFDDFTSPQLHPEWEWNHNPDNRKWQTGNGLTLHTATVTDDLFMARNTLTRRTEGPISVGTIELDLSDMKDGDIAGLAAFRDLAAWVGVQREEGANYITMKTDLQLSPQKTTISKGRHVSKKRLQGDKVWLRMRADIRTLKDAGTAEFFYSSDGEHFLPIGQKLVMTRDWRYFLGYRFGIFNYATMALGGSVTVNSFTITVSD